MKFSETMPVGYARMQQERREMNREIEEMVQQNIKRHLEETKVRTMGPSKETLKRLRMKREQLNLANEGPTLVKKKVMK